MQAFQLNVLREDNIEIYGLQFGDSIYDSRSPITTRLGTSTSPLNSVESSDGTYQSHARPSDGYAFLESLPALASRTPVAEHTVITAAPAALAQSKTPGLSITGLPPLDEREWLAIPLDLDDLDYILPDSH